MCDAVKKLQNYNEMLVLALMFNENKLSGFNRSKDGINDQFILVEILNESIINHRHDEHI